MKSNGVTLRFNYGVRFSLGVFWYLLTMIQAWEDDVLLAKPVTAAFQRRTSVCTDALSQSGRTVIPRDQGGSMRRTDSFTCIVLIKGKTIFVYTTNLIGIFKLRCRSCTLSVLRSIYNFINYIINSILSSLFELDIFNIILTICLL